MENDSTVGRMKMFSSACSLTSPFSRPRWQLASLLRHVLDHFVKSLAPSSFFHMTPGSRGILCSLYQLTHSVLAFVAVTATARVDAASFCQWEVSVLDGASREVRHFKPEINPLTCR